MSEWKNCVLGDYAKVLGGYAFKSADFSDSGDFPVIKIKNVASGTLDMSGCQYVSQQVADSATRFRAKRGDILIAMTGSHVHQPSSMVGKVTRYLTDEEAYINQRVGKVYAKDAKKLNEDFLYYFLKWDETTYGLALSAGGSANQANISAGQIEGLKLALPCFSEQTTIGEILYSLDLKIDLLTRQSTTLESLAEAYFENLFPRAYFGDLTIGEYITPKRGKTLVSKDAIWGNIPVIAGGLEPNVYHNESNTIAPVVTISASGANAGFVNLWSVPVWCSDSSYIDLSMTEHVYFWYVMLKKRQKEIYDSQTGSAQPHVYPAHIADMPTIALDSERISDFNTLVTPLFKKANNNNYQIESLQKIRDTLLPKLISGEVRVKQ